MITSLETNQIFVFGSNLVGNHAGGAALQAKAQFGAVNGIGEGLTGQCYAFPTLDHNFKQLSKADLASAREAFYRCTRSHPDKVFLLTKVGCGIAGYPEEDMKALFTEAPRNVIKPKGWR